MKNSVKKGSSKSQGGVRLVGGRIYDSQNGKTCHQCRQKTMDFAASCKNHKGNKQCTINICHKCLLNRYGEKAEEVVLLDDWTCPKCRGICNCSFCMKKRGHKPTGALVHTAKEYGFSSVSDLLHTKGPESLDDGKGVKDDVVVSSNKSGACDKGSMVASLRILGKENSLDGSSGLDVIFDKKSKKTKRKGLKEISNGYGDDDDANLRKSGYKKPKLNKEVAQDILGGKVKEALNHEAGCVGKIKSQPDFKMGENGAGIRVKEKKIKKRVANRSSVTSIGNAKCDASNDLNIYNEKSCQLSKGAKFKDGIVSNGVKDHAKLLIESSKFSKYAPQLCSRSVEPTIQLPVGTCITTVAGVEFSPEDVGHALQFLEFCAAFGKALELRKGQPEAVMRELVNGQRERRSQYRSQHSLVTQIHFRLLKMVQKDTREESETMSTKKLCNSWFQSLGEYISSEGQFMSKEFPSECFSRGNEGYDELKISEKLKLLNLLCDEALNSNVLRSWIDDEESKFLERQKKVKEKVLAAKDKEKLLKQRMQDELAKTIIERNGIPLTISEHHALVSQIKREAALAHAATLKAMGMASKERQRSDAVRTDPVVLDVDGRAFWRLNCCHDLSDMLLQEMGAWSSVASDEKWFCYTPEQKEEVEKYAYSLRMKRFRNLADSPYIGTVEATS